MAANDDGAVRKLLSSPPVRWTKREGLRPLRKLLLPWARSAPPTALKKLAMRRVMVTQLGAERLAYRRTFDDGRVFSGSTGDLLPLFVYLFDVWEPHLTRFIRHRLSESDVFIDVGANQGWFTLVAASVVGSSGRVVAVEAAPELCVVLRENVDDSGFANVRIVNAAAGSEAGTVAIVAGPERHTGLTRVVAGNDVRCDTLPSLVGDADWRAARLVKIDVEGAEYDVVRGLASGLGDTRHDAEFVIEVGPERASTTEAVEELFRVFRGAGFSAYRMPNEYTVRSYMEDQPLRELPRLDGIPAEETDVVFSRHDGPSLPA